MPGVVAQHHIDIVREITQSTAGHWGVVGSQGPGFLSGNHTVATGRREQPLVFTSPTTCHCQHQVVWVQHMGKQWKDVWNSRPFNTQHWETGLWLSSTHTSFYPKRNGYFFLMNKRLIQVPALWLLKCLTWADDMNQLMGDKHWELQRNKKSSSFVILVWFFWDRVSCSLWTH